MKAFNSCNIQAWKVKKGICSPLIICHQKHIKLYLKLIFPLVVGVKRDFALSPFLNNSLFNRRIISREDPSDIA